MFCSAQPPTAIRTLRWRLMYGMLNGLELAAEANPGALVASAAPAAAAPALRMKSRRVILLDVGIFLSLNQFSTNLSVSRERGSLSQTKRLEIGRAHV